MPRPGGISDLGDPTYSGTFHTQFGTVTPHLTRWTTILAGRARGLDRSPESAQLQTDMTKSTGREPTYAAVNRTQRPLPVRSIVVFYVFLDSELTSSPFPLISPSARGLVDWWRYLPPTTHLGLNRWHGDTAHTSLASTEAAKQDKCHTSGLRDTPDLRQTVKNERKLPEPAERSRPGWMPWSAARVC